MFFGVFWIFPKNPVVLFGFSRFLVLENLENPKKKQCCFWIFRVFIEKSKKHNVFLDFSIKTTENPKTTIGFFGFSRISKSKNLENQKTISLFLSIFR